MASSTRPYALLTLTLLPALALAACKNATENVDPEVGVDSGMLETGGEESNSNSAGDGDGDGDLLDMPDEFTTVDLRIEPANAVIEIVDGVIPPLSDFTAIATNNQGNESPVDASGLWSFDRQDLALLDPA